MVEIVDFGVDLVEFLVFADEKVFQSSCFLWTDGFGEFFLKVCDELFFLLELGLVIFELCVLDFHKFVEFL
jgi:hypothetical protein